MGSSESIIYSDDRKVGTEERGIEIGIGEFDPEVRGFLAGSKFRPDKVV